MSIRHGSPVSAGDPPEAGTAAWYVREASLSRGRWRVRCHLDDRHPDGTIVDGDHAPSDAFVLWHADADDASHARIDIAPGVCPGAPDVWFVALRHTNPDTDTMTLVAFATEHHPPGTVIGDAEFFHLPVSNDAQVGAIRWWPDEAVVDQVYVGDEWRRHHLATVMIYTASAYHQHQGWPGRLHSDGRRTQLGVSFVTGLRHPERIAPLEMLLAPMEPDEAPTT